MKIKLILVLALVLLSSCRSAQKETCQKDSDCDNKVCVFGKCQECAQNSDCKDNKTCDNNQCVESVSVSSPESALNMTETSAGCSQTGTIYFDFNVYDIKSAGQDLLTDLAACLRANPTTKITVAGNTDELGTVEYNLALGEKRAKVVSNYLQKSGIDGSRMSTISYGKEKPVDTEHNEEAWAKNRRTDITMD